MNDPGTAEPIAEAAERINPEFSGASDSDVEKLKEEDKDYRDPSLYWFESTAGPLLAGTFGPIASAFNICALSSSWREYLPGNTPDDEGTVIDDPTWLLIINGLSVGIALIANGALLLNMARRLKFVIAQPITIVGFLISTGLLIGDLVAITWTPADQISATSPAFSPQHHAMTSAFYFGIMAAVIYFAIACLMCWTVFGVWRGHFGRQFNLTAAQRTLMLQTMSFVTYLLLGALVFSHIEGWTYLDAVYWADVTLLTVGLGDFSPQTHLGRSLLIPFAIGGILIIGLVIGSIRSLILERGQKKMSARMMEKKRLRAVESVDKKHHRIRVSRFQTIPYDETFSDGSRKREQEFKVMRCVQDLAERDRKWWSLTISLSIAATLWFIGAVVFWVAERDIQGWSYFDSVYFTYVCLLTIGYGDFSPQSESGRPFFVLWSLMAVPSLTILISDMGDTVVQTVSRLTAWIGSLTVLPGEGGFRATAKQQLENLHIDRIDARNFETQKPPGFIAGKLNHKMGNERSDEDAGQPGIHERIADRLASHLEEDELAKAAEAAEEGDNLNRDIHFYHFVLAKESQRLLKDLHISPPKKYSWGEWEYFLKLMSNDSDGALVGGRKIVPEELRLVETEEAWEEKRQTYRWSWLSDKSPLMGHQTETEWLLERLSACLETELKNVRLSRDAKQAQTPPPISLRDMVRRERIRNGGQASGGSATDLTLTRSGSGDDRDMNKEVRKDFAREEQLEDEHEKKKQ